MNGENDENDAEQQHLGVDGRPPALEPVITQGVTRRAALKVLGAIPIVGALGGGMAWAQQAAVPAQQPQPPKTGHDSPNQPAQGASRQPSSAPVQKFFTAAELRTVTRLADDIIPRDDRSPSASEVGVPAFMDFHLSVTDTSEETRVAMRGGLAWLDRESRRRSGVAYTRASATDRHALLDDISWPAKARPEMSAGVAFFSRFRDMVGSGFFSSAAGWKDLQYQGNVFNPTWNGCPEPAMKKLGVSLSMMTTRIAPQ